MVDWLLAGSKKPFRQSTLDEVKGLFDGRDLSTSDSGYIDVVSMSWDEKTRVPMHRQTHTTHLCSRKLASRWELWKHVPSLGGGVYIRR